MARCYPKTHQGYSRSLIQFKGDPISWTLEDSLREQRSIRTSPGEVNLDWSGTRLQCSAFLLTVTPSITGHCVQDSCITHFGRQDVIMTNKNKTKNCGSGNNQTRAQILPLILISCRPLYETLGYVHTWFFHLHNRIDNSIYLTEFIGGFNTLKCMQYLALKVFK